MFKLTSILALFLFFAPTLFGQNIDMEQEVDLDYKNIRLEEALRGITDEYKIKFSYSKSYVPINKKVSIQTDRESLSVALDQLFEDTEVVYANIGDQIVLKKGTRLKQQKPTKPIFSPQGPGFGTVIPPARAIEQDETLVASNGSYEYVKDIPVLERYNYGLPSVLSQEPEEEFDSEKYYVMAPEPEPDFSSATAQVSLVPTLGTNMDEAENRTNNISLNVLGGENGGVDGVEVGGLFNKVKKDVNGVQIAGLFNHVGGDVGPSKLIDGKEKKTFGIQIAGLVNVANDVHAVQVGGLVNTNHGTFKGVQVSGLGNRNGGGADGVQVSGLFNINGGDGGVQVAGLMNIAEDIEGTQVSGLFNRAGKVRGMQFALINVSDTVTGATIGLLNFVKKGYNQIEIGGSETMYTQLGFRFGSKRFYNIFQFGAKFEDEKIYGIGYGIGTTIRNKHSDKWQWNAELVASHIVEHNRWFESLSLLGSFRFTAEYRLSKKASLYFGPTMDVLLTDLVDPENKTSPLESAVPTYTIFDNRNNIDNLVDVKGWIGFRAGLRFGRN